MTRRQPLSESARREGSKFGAADEKRRIYDLRTNQRFMLKTNPPRRADLDEFVRLYNPANRQKRQATWSA